MTLGYPKVMARSSKGHGKVKSSARRGQALFVRVLTIFLDMVYTLENDVHTLNTLVKC